jgi:hypothetical protein
MTSKFFPGDFLVREINQNKNTNEIFKVLGIEEDKLSLLNLETRCIELFETNKVEKGFCISELNFSKCETIEEAIYFAQECIERFKFPLNGNIELGHLEAVLIPISQDFFKILIFEKKDMSGKIKTVKSFSLPSEIECFKKEYPLLCSNIWKFS